MSMVDLLSRQAAQISELEVRAIRQRVEIIEADDIINSLELALANTNLFS
jgi:hypothetical protein